MRHGSLFSGIGGFDLAADKMGWENIFHCEWNPFLQQILKYYWPNAISYEDITTTDFSIHRGTIDILTGGFPCQPYSLAGKRKGKNDERHLWPEMLRAIREIQPSWVVGENVFGIVNWNGGMVFNEVQTDLEAEGYEVLPFVLPACGVNAPHRRDRVWFVAFNSQFTTNVRNNPSQSSGNGVDLEGSVLVTEGWEQSSIDTEPSNIYGNASYTCCERLRREINRIGTARFSYQTREITNWENFPTQSPVCDGDDGISSRLDIETVFNGINKPKRFKPFGRWRKESIKGGGNAIVPQVVFQIYQAIEKYMTDYENS